MSQRFSSTSADINTPVGNTEEDGIPAATEPEIFDLSDFPGYDPLVFEDEFHELGFHGDNNPVGEDNG